MASKGYYSVIQYCPDLGRLEAANIGVLLFCPERGFLDALTAKHNERIRKFFGSKDHDWKKINSFKLGIEERIRAEYASVSTVEDLREFIDRRANQFRITDPQPMRVRHPTTEVPRCRPRCIARGCFLVDWIQREFAPRALPRRIGHCVR